VLSAVGPTVGALLTISLNEGLRVAFGTNFIGAANTIYGILLVLFIIFMPRGIVGTIQDAIKGRRRGKTAFYRAIRRPSSADQ
jgi:branched-chain amino acid transport system permease protein